MSPVFSWRLPTAKHLIAARPLLAVIAALIVVGPWSLHHLENHLTNPKLES
jgi:hypothetical protein